MNGFSRFFVRLRWKFMIAYAAITLVSAVLVLFVSISVQSWAMLRHSSYPGYQIQEDLQELRIRLRNLPVGPEEREAIEEGLREFVEDGGGRRGDSAPGMNTRLSRGNVKLLTVIDARGKVVATYPAGALATGTSLREPFPPEGDIVINDTLYEGQGRAGEGLRDPDSGDLFVGMPLGDGGNGPGSGVVVRYRPTLYDLLKSGLEPLPYVLVPVLVFSLVVGALFGMAASWWLTRRLGRVTDAARSWSRADFSRTIRDASGDEVGTLARTLNGMAEELRNLMATRGELAAVEERNRVARDLHDSVKQQVFAAALQVGAARELIENEPRRAAEALERAETMIRDAGRGLTVLIRELRPVELEGKGITAALQAYASRWARDTGIQAEVRARGERPTPLRLEQELFRVAQEALNNVARHSRASRVDLRLEWSAELLVLTITDNGRGGSNSREPGSGIRNMRERTESVGGVLGLEDARPGTRVTASVPMETGPDTPTSPPTPTPTPTTVTDASRKG